MMPDTTPPEPAPVDWAAEAAHEWQRYEELRIAWGCPPLLCRPVEAE